MVAPQLVEWLLPIPEFRCSNPDIGEHRAYYTVLKRRKENQKVAGNGPMLISSQICSQQTQYELPRRVFNPCAFCVRWSQPQIRFSRRV